MPKAAKKPREDNDRSAHVSTTTEMCCVFLDPDLAGEMQDVVQAAERRVGQLHMQRIEDNKTFNRTMKNAQDELNKAIKAIADGEQEVMCEVERDRYENVARIYYRGRLVRTRPLTAEERQASFRFDTAGGGKNTSSKAAVAKQPGLAAMPDEPAPAPEPTPTPETHSQLLHRLGWRRDENQVMTPPDDVAPRFLAIGETLFARSIERVESGRDPRCVLAWAEDRKTFDDQLPALADKYDHETFDAVVKEVNEHDLSCETALALLDGKVTAEEARKLPRPGDPIVEPPAFISGEVVNVNPDHVPLPEWVDLTDEERAKLKADIGTESEAIVEWAIHLLKSGTDRANAIASAKRHEAGEEAKAEETVGADAPEASEKQLHKANNVQQKLEPKVGRVLADCARDDVMHGAKMALAKEKAIEAHKQSRTLTPEQMSEIGGDDSAFFADFLSALYAGADFNEALLDAKIACQKHADNLAAAKRREELEAAQRGEGAETTPATDEPREDIAAAATAAFDEALPPKTVKVRKKTGGAR